MVRQVQLIEMEPAELSRLIADEVAKELAKVMAERSPPLLVDRQRMAEMASISTTTLDGLVKAGAVPSTLIGSKRLFQPAAVIEALTKKGQV